METAPDLLGLDVEGADDEPPTGRRTSAARRCRWHPAVRNGASVPELAGWLDIDGVAGLPEGQLTTVDHRDGAGCSWPT